MFKLVQRLCGYARPTKNVQQRRTLGVCADGQPPPEIKGVSLALCEEADTAPKTSAALRWLVDEMAIRRRGLISSERKQYSRIGTSVDNFRPGELLAATPAVMTLSTCAMLLGAIEGVLRPEEELDQEDAMRHYTLIEALAAALERGLRGLGVEDATRCRLAQADKLLQNVRRVRAWLNGDGGIHTGAYSGAVAVRRLLVLVKQVEDVVQATVEALQKLGLAKKHTKTHWAPMRE